MLLCFCTTSIWAENLFWEGGGGKNKGKAVDRRQKVEEGEASKSRRSCGSWRKMRKKVSLHQTHQLPLLQRVPAQKLDETRHLTLNPGPTALLAVRTCLHVIWISFFSLVFGEKFWDKDCDYILHCSVLATRRNVAVLFQKWRRLIEWPQSQVRRMRNWKDFTCAYLMRKQTYHTV